MAPYAAESARSGSQTKTNRQAPLLPRVVPAIPRALTKASKPKRTATPEHSEPTTEPNQAADTHKLTNGNGALDEADSALTPASSASSANRTGLEQRDNNGCTVTDVNRQLGELEIHGNGLSSNSPIKTQTEAGAPQNLDRSTNGSTRSRTYTHMQHPQQQPPDEHFSNPTPPLFHPDAISTPSSVTSPMLPTGPFAVNENLSMYHPRPIPRNLAFGGPPDSSNTSPAPPLSAGAPRFPLPPPGFAPPNAAAPAFYPSAPAQHVAESQAQMMYPPSHIPPPNGLPLKYPPPLPPMFDSPHGWIAPGGPAAFAPAYSPPQSIPHEAMFANGAGPTSRSLSHASSEGHELLSQAAPERVSRPQDQSRPSKAPMNGSTLHSTAEISQYAVNQSAVALANHLQAILETQDFADIHLELATNPPVSLSAHSVIVSRCPRIGHALYNQPPSYNERGMRTVKLSTRDKFVRSDAFLNAFRYLYGAPLLTPEFFGDRIPQIPRESYDESISTAARQRMEYTLAYTAVGWLLEVPAIVASGIECAKQLLRWDTIEQALAFALDGGIDPALETNWSNHGRNVRTTKGTDARSPTNYPTYGDFSSDLLDMILHFLVLEFPSDFALNTDAAQLAANPRLPVALDSRPSISDPRLSRLRFGEVPPEESGKALYSTILLSSVLISLPLPLLKGVLEHPALTARLGRDRVLRFMYSVTEEREERRTKVLKSKRVSVGATGSEQNLWFNVPWEESVEPFNESDLGFTLVRHQNTQIQLPAAADK